ncbi:MAG TPA: molybdopterin molybdotransferase MoeA [Rariglobus sp.]|jgi:molybdopterin molybdotransferase|nr:molybdopterin molybdotransferase MoeA [Rariglobus sp.]
MLITPADAERIVLESVHALPAEDCPLSQAHGRVLREPLKADRDLPPFDRVTMDGYALDSAAFDAGRRSFRVASVQAAGMIPHTLPTKEACVEIMTGSALPTGADCVVPYEETSREGDIITLASSTRLARGANLHLHGSDSPAGSLLVPTGTRLTGREIAVAASVGAAVVSVAMRPSVAVLATGDELVEVDYAHPAPHHIRKSNDYALRAALLSSGLVSRAERFHLRDLPHEIESTLQHIIAGFDVVILTGGVSKGKFDHIPAALAKLGVVKKIHGVAQRPGKPFWFGFTPRATSIFALPGNPVSCYTCLHRYVFPALARMAGLAVSTSDYVTLSAPVRVTAPLALLLPVTLDATTDGRRSAVPAPFNTSGDFAGLVGTDGFVELPPGPAEFPAGTVAKFWRWS